MCRRADLGFAARPWARARCCEVSGVVERVDALRLDRIRDELLVDGATVHELGHELASGGVEVVGLIGEEWRRRARDLGDERAELLVLGLGCDDQL